MIEYFLITAIINTSVCYFMYHKQATWYFFLIWIFTGFIMVPLVIIFGLLMIAKIIEPEQLLDAVEKLSKDIDNLIVKIKSIFKK